MVSYSDSGGKFDRNSRLIALGINLSFCHSPVLTVRTPATVLWPWAARCTLTVTLPL